MKPKFFSTPAEFREWLEKNYDSATELLIGFHKKSSGKKSITYHEALEESLCFGWIDGVRRRLNETSYEQRFTPRKPKSIWSLVNVNHVERLKKEGPCDRLGSRRTSGEIQSAPESTHLKTIPRCFRRLMKSVFGATRARGSSSKVIRHTSRRFVFTG
jgi:hypothetical protein